MRSALHLVLIGALLALTLVFLPGRQGGGGEVSTPTPSTAIGTKVDPFDARPPLAPGKDGAAVRATPDAASKEPSAEGWTLVPAAWIPSNHRRAWVVGQVLDADERPLAGVEVTCTLWGDGFDWQHARTISNERGAFEMSIATGDLAQWVRALRMAELRPMETEPGQPGIRTSSTVQATAWPTLQRVGMEIRARDPRGSTASRHFSALPSAGARTEVDLRFAAEPALEGAVVNALGFGVRGAWVGLAGSNGELYGEAQRSGKEGEFQLTAETEGASRQAQLVAWEAQLGRARISGIELPRPVDAARLELSLAGGPSPCPFEEQLPGISASLPESRTTWDGSAATTGTPRAPVEPGLWVHLEPSAAWIAETRAGTPPEVELFLGRCTEDSEAIPLDWSLQLADSPPGTAPLLPCCGGPAFLAPGLSAGRYRMQIRVGGVAGALREFSLGTDRHVVVEFELGSKSEAVGQ